MALRLQARSRAGQVRLELEPGATLGSLVALLSEKTGVSAHRLQIRSGFPPKPLAGGTAEAPASGFFRSGESLIVEESDEPSVPATAAAAAGGPGDGPPAPPRRPAAPDTPPPINSSGTGVRRVVNADNSCLFTSIAYTLKGKDRAAGGPLRDVVAQEILGDPGTYSEAILGMEPGAYAQWIKATDHWGGGIELAVLSDHFSAVVVAWDIQTLRADRYGEGKGFKQCVHVLYDGLHYDALALSMLEDVPPESEEFDITVFHPEDRFMDEQVKKVVRQLQAAKQYTDTQKFTLRCLVCQQGLVGEQDCVAHAKATGHQNFAEYK